MIFLLIVLFISITLNVIFYFNGKAVIKLWKASEKNYKDMRDHRDLLYIDRNIAVEKIKRLTITNKTLPVPDKVEVVNESYQVDIWE